MILTWQLFIYIMVTVAFKKVSSEELFKANRLNWVMVESLAEENPHIVSLLDKRKKYLCTGTAINRKTVLTSGTCIKPDLYYIAMRTAVLNQFININNLFLIKKSKLHEDYTFKFEAENPNETKMHSNLGLVISRRPLLDLFFPRANIGNYYATELRSRDLVAVGFGPVGYGENIVLQSQVYHQTPCNNPKWYYCVCGYELAKYIEGVRPFGEGAPVYLGSELIGVAATPCGSLEVKSTGRKYNIITVIGPYAPWIGKASANVTGEMVFRSFNGAEKTIPIHIHHHHTSYIMLLFVTLAFLFGNGIEM